ncbi:MAG: hypothetical protein K2L49_06290 [Muribaculaceae bacterium]|nr:hypothetical protein [Muribaculaceae bacterium]
MKLCCAVMSFVLALSLLSCEEPTGYYNDDQWGAIGNLTGTEWVLESVTYPDSEPEIYDDGINVYKFDADGRGWHRILWSLVEPSAKDVTTYFRWSFTTENFAVIYMADSSESFWLIEKLTPTELWVICAMQDPVLYPGTYQYRCRFGAVGK